MLPPLESERDRLTSAIEQLTTARAQLVALIDRTPTTTPSTTPGSRRTGRPDPVDAARAGATGCEPGVAPASPSPAGPSPASHLKAKGLLISSRSSWSTASDGIAGGSRASAWEASDDNRPKPQTTGPCPRRQDRRVVHGRAAQRPPGAVRRRATEGGAAAHRRRAVDRPHRPRRRRRPACQRRRGAPADDGRGRGGRAAGALHRGGDLLPGQVRPLRTGPGRGGAGRLEPGRVDGAGGRAGAGRPAGG